MQMHNKIAHTAEHAFVGALQQILGITLEVRKVEHRDKDSNAFIRLSNLDLQTVTDAQNKVNSLIQTGRKIKTYTFETMDDAKKHFPNLRANETRIRLSNQPVRVIEIEGHDVAACAMDHASNLSECEFFLVTRVSRIGGAGEYEISFAVQNQAKEASIILSQKILKICQSLGANVNTVENTVKKLNEERRKYEEKLKRITSDYLDNIKPTAMDDSGKIYLIQEILYGLDDKEILGFAGRKTSTPHTGTIVMLIHVSSDKEENASVVFARSPFLNQIDCNKLFRQLSSSGAKGGGKPDFAVGVVSKDKKHHLINYLTAEIRKILK
jgi:alanyl-tRNA synthetase